LFFPTPTNLKLFLRSNAKTHRKHESSMALVGNYCSVSVPSSEAQQIPRVICHNCEQEKDS